MKKLKLFEEYNEKTEDIVDYAELSYEYLKEEGFKVHIGSSNLKDYDLVYITINKNNNGRVYPFNSDEIKSAHERFLNYLNVSKSLWIDEIRSLKSIRFSYVGLRRGFHSIEEFPLNKKILELYISYTIK